MSKQVPWNKPLLDEFNRIACLSEDEYLIMKTRMQGVTRTQQADMLGMSVASVDRMIARLKVKYDNARGYSDILPPRKSSAKETYMDEH